MTTPLAQAAIASFIALSTKDTLHQLQPGLERLYSKTNKLPYSAEPQHEPDSEAENPQNSSTTKVQNWVSNVEPAKKNRRQRAKALKTNTEAAARTEQSATSKDSKNETKPSPSSKDITHPSSADDKPKGWRASLTIADIKAQKEEEARMKHEAVHPRRGEQKLETQAINDRQNGKVKARQSQDSDGEGKGLHSQGTPPSQARPQSPSQDKNSINENDTIEAYGTVIEQPQIIQDPRSAQAHTHRAKIQFMHQQPLPPCGIYGCPVKAPHERRAYGFKERNRPSFVKMLQSKMNKGRASGREQEKVERFFGLHGEI